MSQFTANIEIAEAIKELGETRELFNNATNKFRTDEAIYKLKAANSRIEAIRYERMEAIKEEDDT